MLIHNLNKCEVYDLEGLVSDEPYFVTQRYHGQRPFTADNIIITSEMAIKTFFEKVPKNITVIEPTD